jgi:GMP synthase (glutamine-hydrolysing)
MHVLAFRHVPFEHAGLIGAALAARGIELRYADMFENPAAPSDWESAAGLVFMGGPMSANDDLAFIRTELGIIERAVKMGKPVLGVCLGSQLIAKALGARVYKNRVKEIGWLPVEWQEAAATDPLFRGLTKPEVLFHWHGETFDLPAGAVWLASTEGCRHQAFRAGSAYGLQFHLEVTPEMIEDWCRQDANEGDVRELEAPIDARANAARLAELAGLVFGRWAEQWLISESSPCQGAR